jgi:hypothetical protein
MDVHGYIHVREAIDRALEVFAQYANHLSADDIQLKRELEAIRLKFVRSETGLPFSSKVPAPTAPTVAPPPAPAPALPPDLTKAPWSR